ncbi:DUF5655 domain-containing protein [Methanobacterium formicicum]|uniref:DUF5655 domain-containing protein n=1 Tax=Methanobacterium formicicum (strain DSM 3637 / PP1) TaxID=1204725 RepID=K2QBD1_METFP|nr:DUF5655 domain-containing protein [Methanobacterium formicicum]EKF85266.1 hypothetical protein A994_08916 [Methanobacterium formicicum DSM 3637]
MILLIEKEKKELEDLIMEQKLSDMGVWERTHLETWIAERPEILGEELLTITTEYSGFDKTSKRLDILAVDKDGKLVVIELKRDVAETFIDLQAIHYAAFCSTHTFNDIVDIRANFVRETEEEVESEIRNFITNDDFKDFDNQPRIILVANEFKEETLAAVIWLRDIGVDIKCVKLEAYELDEKIIITPDVIIPLPEAENFMMHREKKVKVTTFADPKIFTEEYHLKMASGEVEELYDELKDRIYNLGEDVQVKPTKYYIAFKSRTNFVDFRLQKKQIKIWLNIRKGELDDPKDIARDISDVGHWGNGDYEIKATYKSDLEYIMDLIKQSYNTNS